MIMAHKMKMPYKGKKKGKKMPYKKGKMMPYGKKTKK